MQNIKADPQLVKELEKASSGKADIAYHSKTGYASFIGADFQNPIPTGLPSDAAPEDASRAFLSTYGKLFGLTNQKQELTVKRQKTVDNGRSFVRFQQVHKGIPVLGGELNVQTDAGKNIVSANGRVLPGLAVDVAPKIDAAAAIEKAIGVVAKTHGIDASELSASTPELWIYNPIMLKPARNFNALVWRIEVTPNRLLPIREFVLVDAHSGIVALHFNQIDTVLNRAIYDCANNPNCVLPGTLNRSEGGGLSAITDVNNAYNYAGDTYNFYWTYHARDGIDGAGMQMRSTTRYCPQCPTPYQNAFWNGSQMVYGAGFVLQDVAGHEITHGVTDYESGLFYYYQSGAINESLSDVWGEFIDLTYADTGNDTGVRWLIGEDLSGGAIRSMSDPTLYGDPDRMSSSLYNCDANETDNGGVHKNSGVNNKAAYLMVDGGTFNGYTITGLGITKVAKIYYEAQTNLLLSASDYNDLYNALIQACTNLINTSGITAANCQQVTNAVNAVQMNQQPSSCPANESPLCPSGQSPSNLFFDDLENTASNNWTSGTISGANAWYYPQNPNAIAGFDATYATSGQYNFWGYNQPKKADYFIRMNSPVSLSPSGSTFYMHFNHAYGFEDGTPLYGDYGAYYDGGIVEYSANNGTWTDAGSFFLNNGYNGTISDLYENPLGGRSAFVGESGGYISSRLNITSLAGQGVRFRFRIGTDLTFDDYGWFIDDIRIYTCLAAAAPPTAPSGLTASAASTSQINLSWGDTTANETGFRIERKIGAGGAYSQIATVWADITTYSDTGLTASTTYYYRVRAYNDTGASPYSNETSATTQSPPPDSSSSGGSSSSESGGGCGMIDSGSNNQPPMAGMLILLLPLAWLLLRKLALKRV